MRITNGESGVSKLKVLIVLGILVIAVIQGIKYLSVQLDYQRMKDFMEAKAGVAQVLKDEEIRHDLVAKSKELGLPLGGENFLITRDEDRRTMTIKTAWEVEVHYLWDLCGSPCVRTYRFEPVAVEGYAGR
jgi:hypothetical protein